MTTQCNRTETARPYGAVIVLILFILFLLSCIASFGYVFYDALRGLAEGDRLSGLGLAAAGWALFSGLTLLTMDSGIAINTEGSRPKVPRVYDYMALIAAILLLTFLIYGLIKMTEVYHNTFPPRMPHTQEQSR